jgi:S-adenosylmethionine:tRNA ribosyltransferase-isomerase
MVPGPAGAPSRHLLFNDLPELLEPGDLLVLNDTRVLPARLLGSRASGGRLELLLLERDRECRHHWWSMMKFGRPPSPGERLTFAGGLRAEVVKRRDELWLLRLELPSEDPDEALKKAGRMPLPPYIRRDPQDGEAAGLDRERYQTVFARRDGAVAAPTAGLHFTRELLDAIQGRGVEIRFLTLHVGIGTFLPVRTENLEQHVMHAESFRLPPETVEAVGAARRNGKRVIAVGTTVVRTLEGCAGSDGGLVPGTGRCSLFIRPGHRFRIVDAMITNFHLPRSTLLVLVSAFAGRERILAAYQEAIREGYRFFSYGDAMFLMP